MPWTWLFFILGEYISHPDKISTCISHLYALKMQMGSTEFGAFILKHPLLQTSQIFCNLEKCAVRPEMSEWSKQNELNKIKTRPLWNTSDLNICKDLIQAGKIKVLGSFHRLNLGENELKEDYRERSENPQRRCVSLCFFMSRNFTRRFKCNLETNLMALEKFICLWWV